MNNFRSLQFLQRFIAHLVIILGFQSNVHLEKLLKLSLAPRKTDLVIL